MCPVVLGGCAAPSHELCKLHGMVDCFRWCDEGLSLACNADAQLIVFHHTELIFIDRELLTLTVSKADQNNEQALAPPLETK